MEDELKKRLLKLLQPVADMAKAMWPETWTTEELTDVMSQLRGDPEELPQDGLRHCETCGGVDFIGLQRYHGYLPVVATLGSDGGVISSRNDTEDGEHDFVRTVELDKPEGPWKCKKCYLGDEPLL